MGAARAIPRLRTSQCAQEGALCTRVSRLGTPCVFENWPEPWHARRASLSMMSAVPASPRIAGLVRSAVFSARIRSATWELWTAVLGHQHVVQHSFVVKVVPEVVTILRFPKNDNKDVVSYFPCLPPSVCTVNSSFPLECT